MTDVIQNDSGMSLEEATRVLESDEAEDIPMGRFMPKIGRSAFDQERMVWGAMMADPALDHVAYREDIAARYAKMLRRIERDMDRRKNTPKSIMDAATFDAVFLHVSAN
jgi:hypothetical protein